MKKLVVLITLLALAFSLFACGKDETDYVFEAFSSMADAMDENALGTFFGDNLDTVRVSVSLDTLDGAKKYESLISRFIGDFTVPDVKDAKADAYFDFKNLSAAQLVKAKVRGEDVNLSVFEDLENVSVESSLLENKYSAKTADLVRWYTGSDEIYNEVSAVLPRAVRAASMLDIAAGAYGETVKDIFRDNVEVAEEKDGENLILTFTLTEKELDSICEDFVDIAEEDKAIASDIFDRIREYFDDVQITLDFEMTVVKKDSTLADMNVAVSTGDGEYLNVAYEYDAETQSFECEAAVLHPESESIVETITLSGAAGEEYDFVWAYANDTAEYSIESKQGISVAITDENVELEYENLYEYIPLEGKPQKTDISYSAVFEYEFKEDIMILELVKAGVNGINITNIKELFGITVEVEKNPTMPKAVSGIDIGSLDNVYTNVVYAIGNKLLELLDL